MIEKYSRKIGQIEVAECRFGSWVFAWESAAARLRFPPEIQCHRRYRQLRDQAPVVEVRIAV